MRELYDVLQRYIEAEHPVSSESIPSNTERLDPGNDNIKSPLHEKISEEHDDGIMKHVAENGLSDAEKRLCVKERWGTICSKFSRI